jgi:Ferritin-like domain
VTNPSVEDSRSRRALLAAGASGAGALLLASCAGSKPLRVKVRSGSKVLPADIEILNGLLDLEHYAIAAYTAGIPLLRRPALKAAQQFLGQEFAHAGALTDLVKQAGGKANKSRASYDLGHPRSTADVLALLARLERAQLTAYVEMIPHLSFGRVRSAVAAIFANDAQHLAVLRSLAGRAPVPAAFVNGR